MFVGIHKLRNDIGPIVMDYCKNTKLNESATLNQQIICKDYLRAHLIFNIRN